MKTKLSVFAMILMLCGVFAVPLSAAPASDLKCGGCKTQCEQKEKKDGCPEKKEECGKKKECDGQKKQECDGQKKEECNKDKDAQAQG